MNKENPINKENPMDRIPLMSRLHNFFLHPIDLALIGVSGVWLASFPLLWT